MRWALEYLSGIFPGAPHLVIPPSDYLIAEALIFDTSLANSIPVHELSITHMNNLSNELLNTVPVWLKSNEMNFRVIRTSAARRLRDKVAGGLAACSPVGKSILHTGPHHDGMYII